MGGVAVLAVVAVGLLALPAARAIPLHCTDVNGLEVHTPSESILSLPL